MMTTVVGAPAGSETATGTTTASHLGVAVGAVAAGEVAIGGETGGADAAPRTTAPTRYGNVLLPLTLTPFYTTKSKGSLSQVFSQCSTPISLSLCISVCVLLLSINYQFH